VHIWNYYQLLFSYSVVGGKSWQKKELWKLKQDQLKLKRENKIEEIDKPYEVMSFKSENKVSLKE